MKQQQGHGLRRIQNLAYAAEAAVHGDNDDQLKVGSLNIIKWYLATYDDTNW